MIVYCLRISALGMLLLLVAFLVWPKSFLAGESTSTALPTRFLPLANHRFVLTPPTSIDKLERIEISIHPNQGPSHLESLDFWITPDCRLSLGEPLEITHNVEILLRPRGSGCSDIVPGQTYRGRLHENSTAPVFVPVTAGKISDLALAKGGGLWSVGILWVEKMGWGTRLGLLADMWNFPVWLFSLGLVLAFLPAAVGMWLLSGPQVPMRRVMTAALLALTPALLLALITPPFQAPDENNHFYAYSKLGDNMDLLQSGMDLGAEGHFSRIRSYRSEIFTPADASGPPVAPMIMQDTHDVLERSTLVSAYWKFLNRLLPTTKANVALCGVRWINALVYALAVFLGAWLLLRAAPELRYPIFLFAVPALPFFAMHLSNHAFAPGLSVIMACLALGFVFKRGDWPMAGVLLGLTCAFALLTTRSLVGLALAGGTLLLPVPFLAARRPWKESLLFWGGIFVGLTPLFLAWNQPQISDLIMVGRGLLMHALPQLSQIIIALTSPLGIVLLLALAFGLERGMHWIYGRKNPHDWTVLRWVLLPVIGLFVAILLIGVGYDRIPGFPNIEKKIHFPLGQYLYRALINFFTGFSPKRPTFLLQASFWGGFAWLEALLPQVMVRLLGTLGGVGIIVFCTRLWKRKDGRQAIMLLTLLLAVACDLLATAFGAHSTHMNLHGRYVLSAYLLFLAPAFAGFAPPEGKQSLTVRLVLSSGACFLVFVAASGSLLLLERFFGCDTLYSLFGHRLG